MAPPITHHTSHTMGNGASSSNSGCPGSGGSAITHHTSHTMANGASSGADGGSQGRGSDVSSSDHGHYQGAFLASSVMGSSDMPQDLTTTTIPDDSFDHDEDDNFAAIDASSAYSSASTASQGDPDDSDDGMITSTSGISSMNSSVNLPTWSIIDSTLREGEQFATAYFDTETKLQIAQALDDFGVDYIEVTSPAASPQSRDDCAAICRLGLKAKVLCHIRCNIDDAKIAVQTGVDGINMCIGTSSMLMEHSHGKDMAYIAAKAQEVIEYVKSHNIEIRFSGEDSFRSDFSEILKLYSLVDKLGADRVGIADTVGGATPMEVYDKIDALRKVVSCDIETHFHNDTGCATANALTAIEAGATHIDTTVLGIGERNGITPLGGLLASLMPTQRAAIVDKYNIEKLAPLEQLVAKVVSVEIPFNTPVLSL